MSESRIQLLDCTLRDGAYINHAKFGMPAMKGIIKNLQRAGVEIIECGWLKDDDYVEGTTYYHMPSDIEPYLIDRKDDVTYVVMIDWDRYDVERLPEYDGKSIDAIRVVFPWGKHREAILVGERIRRKGYQVYFQAANTLAYDEDELRELADCINEFEPVSLSVVDTFGAMFEEDLDRITEVLSENMKKSIKIGFHSHNNQQLSFSLTMHFIRRMREKNRDCVVDASLCGMGRGAGNATTELVVSYLNRKQSGGYDLDAVLDAIDKYMVEFQEKYRWGYSTSFFIAGMYQCHVNNIDYLLTNHRTNAKDMRNIISSLNEEERRKYDYDLLETRYIENQSRLVDDEEVLNELTEELSSGEILLLCPGKSLIDNRGGVEAYIRECQPTVIGVNAVIPGYDYDYLFFLSHARYEYTRDTYPDVFMKAKKLVLSNVHRKPHTDDERLVGFNRVIKRGWRYFDNAAVCCMRLMDQVGVNSIHIAGFDGFGTRYNETYADSSIPSVNVEDNWNQLNEDIQDMVIDFRKTSRHLKEICFVTQSVFDLF